MPRAAGPRPSVSKGSWGQLPNHLLLHRFQFGGDAVGELIAIAGPTELSGLFQGHFHCLLHSLLQSLFSGYLIFICVLNNCHVFFTACTVEHGVETTHLSRILVTSFICKVHTCCLFLTEICTCMKDPHLVTVTCEEGCYLLCLAIVLEGLVQGKASCDALSLHIRK